jgi:phosphoribosylformylglycinamidine synthase
MRHNKKFNHLGRTKSHRDALLANMTISLIMHKRIVTTLAKAKALRMYAEPLINRAKTDDTANRRVVFRYLQNKEAVTELLEERDGLMAGICNGFQALIKLGLVPYGKIVETDEDCATLTYNKISRHQSKLVRTRIASNNSPWLANTKVGEVYTVPISHGEGRFIAPESVIKQLAENGQIITQYVDLAGNPTADIRFNPNNSHCAIEGIVSPDGRVLGKMGHTERYANGLYKNVDGNYDMGLFESAVKYFK